MKTWRGWRSYVSAEEISTLPGRCTSRSWEERRLLLRDAKGGGGCTGRYSPWVRYAILSALRRSRLEDSSTGRP